MNCFFILGNNSGGGQDGTREGLGFVRGTERAKGGAGWALIVERNGRKPEPAGCLIAETGPEPGWEAAWWAASGGLIGKTKPYKGRYSMLGAGKERARRRQACCSFSSSK